MNTVSARGTPNGKKARAVCRHCARPICSEKRLWWSSDGDFLCADGQRQHAPPYRQRHHPDQIPPGEPAHAAGFYMRSANGGTAERIPARRALFEIEQAHDDGVLVEELPGGSRVLSYRDVRGLIELRPATAEESAEASIPETEFYAPGSDVIVRPVHWDPQARAHRVQPEFRGTVAYGLNSGRYRVRKKQSSEDGVYSLGELRPAGRTRRPVEPLPAHGHAVWKTGARVAAPGASPSAKVGLYECLDCRQRAHHDGFASLRCTAEVEQKRSMRLAGELVHPAFARWSHLITTSAGTDEAVFDHGSTVHKVAAELRAGASHVWEEQGLSLSRAGCTTVVTPYRSSEERAAEAAARSAERARWAAVLAATESVLFEDVAVGDVLVRGCHDGRRAEVLGPAEDCTDRFGRAMRRLWCRAMDGSDREGWVEYGPNGHTLRQLRTPPGDGSAARSDEPGDPADGLHLAMDGITRAEDQDTVVRLVRRAAALFAVLDQSASVPEVSDSFRTVMHAVAGITDPAALAPLGQRAAQLWCGAQNPHDDAAGVVAVGCLPEHADHPAVRTALASARRAGTPLAVVRNGHGHEAAGLFVSPNAPGSVECTWFIDGHETERGQHHSRIRRLRPARNSALAEVRRTLTAAGWSVYDKASANTRSPRLLSLLASSPR
ncbi:hypothetical protein [Streptomyces sp. NPDC001889]